MAHHLGALDLQGLSQARQVRRAAYADSQGFDDGHYYRVPLRLAGVTGVSRIHSAAAIPLQQQGVAGQTEGNVTLFGEVTAVLPTLIWMPYLRKACQGSVVPPLAPDGNYGSGNDARITCFCCNCGR